MSLAILFTACETPNPRQQNLPPSETDLVLLKPGTLCQRKTDFQQQHPQSTLTVKAWGTGQELTIPADRSPSHGDESYFFDEDGTLVGALFTFSSGLDLAPYSVLRHTLTLLKPTLEFYLNVANFAAKSDMDSSSLYETGDEKTTTQYLVIGGHEHPALLQSSITIDPHKMGLATIPAGGLLFRGEKCMNALETDTHYLTKAKQTSLTGTRSGAAAAATGPGALRRHPAELVLGEASGGTRIVLS